MSRFRTIICSCCGEPAAEADEEESFVDGEKPECGCTGSIVVDERGVATVDVATCDCGGGA